MRKWMILRTADVYVAEKRESSSTFEACQPLYMNHGITSSLRIRDGNTRLPTKKKKKKKELVPDVCETCGL